MTDEPELPIPDELEQAIRTEPEALAALMRRKYREAPPEKRDEVVQAFVKGAASSRRFRWMTVVGVVLFLVPPAVWIWNRMSEESALAASSPAVAKVTRMVPAGWTEDDHTVRLGLEVHQERRKPFSAELTVKVDVEWLPRVQAGSWMRVGVGKDGSVVFDRKSMEVEPPAPPAY